MIFVRDRALEKPDEHRAFALTRPFGTFLTPAGAFHGIAGCERMELQRVISALFPKLHPSLTFFRRSPLGQEEPNYVHTDADMGDWTAILYLSPDPPAFDGTMFYHYPPGTVVDWKQPPPARRSIHIPAKFNRVVVFPATVYHSRAIRDNYGAGDYARLTQVMFGTGQLPKSDEKGVQWL